MTRDLKQLFAPKSVAILGASARNPWTGFVLGTLDAIGFAGQCYLVNQRGEAILDRATAVSAAAIGEPVDTAFVAVPAAALAAALRDMAAAEIRYGVVVSSGFAETGSAGAALQRDLSSLATDLGITLLGPNSLGFVNLVDRTALSAFPVELPMLASPRVAVVSQSGATAAVLSRIAHATNVSLSHVIAVGNEAQIDLADSIEFLIDCPATRAIAVYAQSARRPAAFLAAARRALAMRKPLVILKVGAGKLAAEVARAHTGALVGDDAVFDAICRDYGIIRVTTLEQLLQTADMIGHTGVLGAGGLGAISISGGACEMIADLGEACGVPFATLSEDTTRQIAALLPDYATVQNPLDTTGGVLANLTLFEDAIALVGNDKAVAVVAANMELAGSAERDKLGRPALMHTGRGLARSPVPGFLLPQSYLDVTAYGRETLELANIGLASSGLGMAMTALGGAFRWSAAVRHGSPAGMPEGPPGVAAPSGCRPETERAVLDYLAARGVPVIPARIATSADEAAALVADLAAPAVLKILSPDIAHKSDVGGVVLDVRGAEAARAHYAAMMAQVAAADPAARIAGVIVSPMRGRGVELIVGVARDPVWGLVLAVGMGGVMVDLMGDADLSLLPVTAAQAEAMLGRLKAAKLLDGFRGMPVADKARLARIIAAIGDAAIALGDDLISLEINPLWIAGSQIECLDALTVWRA